MDLIAVAPDEAAAGRTKAILRDLLEGKYDVPVVNVTTITREEFRRTAPLAQSFAGQAARHGVTPDGRGLDYRPEMDLPGLQLHQLTGNRRGTWAVRVSGNWRLTFRFEDGEAVDVNLEDYH